jgi:hypothetical protein
MAIRSVVANPGAPADASYLALGTNSRLVNERVLTAGTGVALADGGAGSTLTINAATLPFANYAVPVDANFSWVNQGGATSTQLATAVYLYGPPTAPDSLRIRQKSIANTSTGVISIAFLPNSADSTAAASLGIVLRESGTSKVLVLRYACGTVNPGLGLYVTYGPSATSLTTNPLVAYYMPPTPVWMRVSISGSNYVFAISADGTSWLDVKTLAKTTPFTTAADQWGFFVDAPSSNSGIGMTLLSFSES